MSRAKISEFTAKKTLYPAFNLDFTGYAVTPSTTSAELTRHFGNQNLVIKVDQGIKKRGQQGLVRVNVTPQDIPAIIKSWVKLGWTQFLAEPVVEHDSSAEEYLSLNLTRVGWQVLYSRQGGVDVETNWDQVGSSLPEGLKHLVFNSLIPQLDQSHISFLEINPLVVRGNKIYPLDMAALVDSVISPLPTLPDRAMSQSEILVANLDSKTPASLKFRLINPSGRIWMLLSGGGASLVLADEVADLGMGSELANYGEYSGAPTDDDVYSYTKIILSDLLQTTTKLPRALVVAGGVANFTDVAKTFRGLIRALDEQKELLQKSRVKVFVRRGGPNESTGLANMRDFLSKNHLLGSVHGHETPLTQVISEVKNYLK